MSTVICKLPRAGLGNQLFPLMKAYLFAHLNKLPVTVINYHQIKIGPYLRNEKNKRKYSQYFIFQKSILSELLDKIKFRFSPLQRVVEPSLARVADHGQTMYFYNAIPHWSNFFDQLNEHRRLVIDLFWKVLHRNIIAQVDGLKSPEIGLHIRMGDFRKLAQNEDFSKVGSVRTPEQYFIDTISEIRKAHGSNLNVSVFTDGRKEELQTLFTIPNISLIEGNSDIVDLLLLSKSKVIVVSAGSTFSYWAGFLSEAPIILHPHHIHKRLRSVVSDGKLYEGPADATNQLFVTSIQSII